MKIKCEWMNRNEAITNPDGQIIPCCFFANKLMVSMWFNYPQTYSLKDHIKNKGEASKLTNYPLNAFEAVHDPILKSYIEQKDKLNIFNNSMEEILDQPWWKELYESWKDEEKVSPVCKKYCSVEDD